MVKILLPRIFSALAVVSLVAACASVKQTENTLSAAGFHPVAATSPQQVARMNTLPAGQVSTVTRGGKPYYVYPDAKQGVLYVGTQKEYAAYRKLQIEQKVASEQDAAAEFNAEAAQDSWDGFSDDWYGAD